ncbi:MAG TPA: branched-chain amino acid ABC transporter permease [Terrimesophilobacter sp.]|nr:branched-chain amino acid ABC transporter permease [Terrimesophilobacter sp.]HRP99521.1 branched-chain amino acid ABC transporter permease [Terrimesophilobacter sp.]
MNRQTILSTLTHPAVKWGLGAALVLLLALLPLLAIEIPGILPGPSYTPGSLQLLAFAMLIAALALSYHLIFGVAGLLSFGHALYFAAGAYGLGIALRHLELDLVTAIVFVLVVGLIIAGVVGALSLRATGIGFAMVTLAFAQAGSVLVRRNPGGLTNGDEGLALATANIPDVLIGVVNTKNLYWMCLAVLVIVFLITTWFEKSRAGHVVAATRENIGRVRVIGIRPYFVQLLAFVISGILATLVGMAYMLLQSSATQKIVTAEFTLSLLVIVVLGGVGYRWGAVIGGIVYTFLDQRLTTLAGSEAIAGLPDFLRIPLSEPLFILGTLFILVVLFLPGGISGVAIRLTRGKGSVAKDRTALEELA